MAYVIAPDGTPGTIDDGELEKAVTQGFKVRPPTAEELAREEAAKSPLRAGAEAAVRSAAPFVGAKVLANIDAEFTGQSRADAMEAQRLRSEENPASTAVGSGLGFVLGPGKLINGALAPVRATGLLGAFGAGALEGTAMGVSEAVNESVLDNTPLTADLLASSAVGSALAGGAMDFGLGAVGKIGSAVLKKAGGTAVSSTLRDMSTRAIRAELVSKPALREFGEKHINDAIERGFREGIITRGTTFETGTAAAQASRDALKPQYDALLDGVESVMPAASNGAKDVLDAVKKSLSKFDNSLLEKTADAQLSELEQVLMRPNVTWRQIHAVQSGLYESLPSVGAPTGPKKVIDTMRDAINKALDAHLERGVATGKVPGLAAGAAGTSVYKKLSRDYAEASTLYELFNNQFLSSEARALGMKELALGGAAGIATGGVGGAGLALGTTFLGKQIRERGGFVLGGAMRQLADSGVLNRIASSFQKNVMQRLAMAPELLGPFRAVIEQAAAQGAMDLLETHMQLASSSQGQDYMRRMGMVPESPEEMQVMGEKLSALEAVRTAAEEQQAALNSAVDGVFGSAAGRKPSIGGSLSLKEFDKARAGIQSVLANPEGMYAKVPSELHASAPSSVGQTAVAVVRAAQFLDSKMPKDPNAGMPPSVAPPWEPSKYDLDKFNRYKEAVENPARVLKNMAAGYISPEQVEAIQAVYPALYADLQQKIGERLMMHKKPLSYQQRLAMSAIIGPGALSMTPQQVQILQQTQAEAAQPPQPAGGSGPDGRQDVNQENNLDTQAQRLEGR